MLFICLPHQISLFYQVIQVMSLPTISNVLLSYYSHLSLAYDIYLSSSPPPVLAVIIWPLVLFHFFISTVHLTFIKAVIIILKHATSLRLSKLSPESALTHAELDYREADIDSKIRQHLTASSSREHSVELSAGFIKGCGSFVLASVTVISC
ncbi:hypothetical protein EDB83DRAFT_2418270 [Lactarius deliciosus]|nr:hypothetical protein EDB83DRAFT_2422114 [Lactarius deliciosus]KAH9033160.1 hypothetical protein EDB83DRAFT_2418270 [Lactarius deliciosus]